MEPASALATIGPIIKAAKTIDELLDNADRLAEDDAKYYITYIDVAKTAIIGIEGGYIDILKEAAKCRIKNDKESERLRSLINAYIDGEVLRPKLKEAIDRLRQGREALKNHAVRLLVWPKVKKNRLAALEEYDQLLNKLTGYFGALGGYRGPSAVALDDIKKIQSALSGTQNEFSSLINELRLNLDKGSLLSISGECGRVIETLRIAFR